MVRQLGALAIAAGLGLGGSAAEAQPPKALRVGTARLAQWAAATSLGRRLPRAWRCVRL